METIGFDPTVALSLNGIAMEACGEAHYWARELAWLGHVKLTAPRLAETYAARGKMHSTFGGSTDGTVSAL